MKTLKNKYLKIMLSVFFGLYLIFGGAAALVSITDNGIIGTGLVSGISWMWIPALIFLSLVIWSARELYNHPVVIKLRNRNFPMNK